MPGINSIDGLVSNLDTSAIVEAIMGAERSRVELMQARQVAKTDQITVYNSISALLLGLKAKCSALALPSNFDKNRISVSDDSFITAAASGDVATGSYRISINQLARNHQIASQGFADSASTEIGTGEVRIAVGDGSVSTIIVDSTNNTLRGLMMAINEADAGVSASVINDGSSSNPYRLLLTASETGSANQIDVTVELSGGTVPDFTGSSFDAPETLKWSSSATTILSLGPTASYSGSGNKTYTFTIQGSGAQTIGSGDVIVDWTDEVNSGTIVVSQADTEVSLGSGDGADGLSLTFSAGTLVGGDTFQVQGFSPLVQAAQDAKVSMGSAAGGGSPITVTSPTNTLEDLIPGVTLSLKKMTDSNTPDVTVTAEKDIAGVRQTIDDFLSQYNEVIKRIDEYLKYNSETKEAGTLQGDTTLISIQNRLRSLTSTVVNGLDSGYRMLADIGIRTSALGRLSVVNNSALTEALNDNLSDVMKLFTSWGKSTNPKITFLGSTNASKASSSEGYDVDITQVATSGYLRGTTIANPSDTPLVIGGNNDTLKLRVDGIVSGEIVLTNRTYNSFEDLAAELQNKIDRDDRIGTRGTKVSYVDTGDTGYLVLESSSFGSNAKVEIQAGITDSAFIDLGLAQGTVFAGRDVSGTINGEEAEGLGRMLAGKAGNSTTDGLRLRIELEEGDLAEGAEANLVVVKGVGSKFDDLLESLTKSSEGLLARRAGSIQKQIDYMDKRIEDEEERLATRKEALFKRFYELERLLNDFSAQGAFLETQLSQLSSFWKWQSSSNRG